MAEPAINKTYVVTGATSGIGRAITEELLEKGMSVIGIGRSSERCEAARDTLAQQYPQGRITYLLADLSLQTAVRGLRPAIEQQLTEWKRPALDGLVNNAGTFTFHRTITGEGFEKQWAVNHLAPFLLTYELLPLLQSAPSARIISVSSGSHFRTSMNWDDLQFKQRYRPLRAYQQSKLANVLFIAELRRRLGSEASITAFAADPGLVNTRIGLKSRSPIARLVWDLIRRRGIQPEESARGIITLLLDQDIHDSPHVYWKHGKPMQPNLKALDAHDGERLWAISVQMCHLESSPGPA